MLRFNAQEYRLRIATASYRARDENLTGPTPSCKAKKNTLALVRKQKGFVGNSTRVCSQKLS